MRTIIITLPYEVAHRLEIRAGIDNISLKSGIELLLTEIVREFEGER